MKRVIRVIVIEGPDEWVDKVLADSWLQPDNPPQFPGNNYHIEEVSRSIKIVE